MSVEKFGQDVTSGYAFDGPSIILGAGIYEGEVQKEKLVRIPLKTLNRHGLIAGATGTGKTKTLQIIAEQISAHGIPSLLMDIKGDLSGIAAAAEDDPKWHKRLDKIGIPFIPDRSPVEFLSLSKEPGVRLRSTLTEFGPVLLSKIMDLNETQGSVLSLIYKWSDDNELPLVDLQDLRKVLQYLTNEGKDVIKAEYGSISTSSMGAIMRKIVELEQQGADTFFGEISFDPDDLCRLDANGKGIVSILRLTDIQDKPKLFSTFMLQILAEIYSIFPEEGDMEKPKLCLFIDEAHLIFDQAPKVLLNQINTIIKLIRSKGIGVFFITQNPNDVPDEVLGQLGLKVQHALRAFTAKDRKAIKTAAENFPLSEFYKTDQVLTEMGIGEALVTALNEKGIPTPLVHTYVRAPQSRMDVLTSTEIDNIVRKSFLLHKYDQKVDRQSAYEILNGKLEEAYQEAEAPVKRSNEKSTFEKVINHSATKQFGRTVARELARNFLGVLGVKKTTRRSTKSKSIFDLF